MRQSGHAYEERIMSVSRHTFQRCANNLQEEVRDRTGNEQAVWLVPAPFWVMQYINDERYLPGDGSWETNRLVRERQNSVAFYQTQSPDIYLKFESHPILAIRAVMNIDSMMSFM